MKKMRKFGLILAYVSLVGCAEAPEGSTAWLMSSPAQEVVIEGTHYRILQRDDPNVYYAVEHGLWYINPNLEYIRNAVAAIEVASGCKVIERQLHGVYVEALVNNCSVI